jgi:hypothetical protein
VEELLPNAGPRVIRGARGAWNADENTLFDRETVAPDAGVELAPGPEASWAAGSSDVHVEAGVADDNQLLLRLLASSAFLDSSFGRLD